MSLTGTFDDSKERKNLNSVDQIANLTSIRAATIDAAGRAVPSVPRENRGDLRLLTFRLPHFHSTSSKKPTRQCTQAKIRSSRHLTGCYFVAMVEARKTI